MTTFEALSARRRTYVEAARDNGFEQGLRKLLADLYPDNAHFIYELLQNAEDAGARHVDFNLHANGLEVRHDGSLLFDLEDITSITGIGQSTKVDDATSIGKFGVGFKAVFAYTQTPAISSGEYSFAIHDLFVPVPVPGQTSTEWTTFSFPFDRADKPAERAVREVANALREISGTTLLFLKNIHSISCSLPDGDGRFLDRRSLDENVVEIDSLQEEAGPSYWYRIAGDVIIEDKSYPVAAAFALEPHTSKQSEQNKPKEPRGFTVKPVDGQVFIYFPAVRETSGLKFHVHAPFGSTVARDSVRDDPGNDELVKGIADLVAAGLLRMREAGLITDGLLSALPNDSDDLPKRYSVVRKQIISAFSTGPLAPVLGGGHALAGELLRSERSIRSALSIDDVNLLRGLYLYVKDDLATGWLAEREGRAGAFLSSLHAMEFTRDELTQALERVATITESIDEDEPDDEDRIDLESWHAWICSKDDAWLRKFYIALETLVRKTNQFTYYTDHDGDDYLNSLSEAPLIRIQSDGSILHVPGPQAYLPTAPGLIGEHLVVDALAVFDDYEADNDQEALRSFYRRSGVKVWDAAAQLAAKFSAYSKQPAAITSQHLADLKTLQKLLDDKAVSPLAFAHRDIFVAVRKDGRRYWAKPGAVFLDEPFGRTGLASLFESDEYLASFDGRYQPIGRLDPEYEASDIAVALLASELNAWERLKIVRVGVTTNPGFRQTWMERETAYKKDSDWDIRHFDMIVSVGDETLLGELWRTVTSASAEHAEALYRSNGSSRPHVLQSQLLQKLMSKPWILDLDDNLRLPEDITFEELAKGLSVPLTAPLLERAGFGRKAAANAERNKEDAELAKRYFESLDEMQRIAELYKRNPDKFKAHLESFESELRLPEASSSAPGQRAKRAGDSAADAPGRRYDQRMRSVYVQEPGHLSAARGYLVQLYTNDDGVMVCQVCTGSMPFKIRGEYYFEAVQFVKGAAFDFRENRIAACPTCAAKYRHALETSLEDLRDDLLTQSIGHLSSVSVDVQLAGDAARIRFVGKHAIDLQGVFSATAGEPIEYEEADHAREGQDSGS